MGLNTPFPSRVLELESRALTPPVSISASIPAEPPLVSVIVPMFNAASTIGRTLASACAQTHSRLEIVVVDDGSLDDGPDIVARFAHHDDRIRLIRQPNAGVAAARNAGVAVSKGHLIAPLDADDLWHPAKTALQIAAMRDANGQDDSTIGLVYCWYTIIDENDKIRIEDCRSVAEGDVLKAMAQRNIVGHGSGALIRREALLGAGGYDPTLRYRGGEGCEDYKLYFQIAERYRFALVREYLVGYRETSTNMSSDPRKALRSRDLCVPELAARYPELNHEFHAGRLRLMRFMLGRAVRNGNIGNAFYLLEAMLRTDPLLTVLNLYELIKALARRLTRRTGGNVPKVSIFPSGVKIRV